MKLRTASKAILGMAAPVLFIACSGSNGSPTANSTSALGSHKPIIVMGTASSVKPHLALSANDVTYYGGPVIPSAQVYTIFWGSGATSLQTDLNSFFTAITNSSFLDNLAQYSTATQTIGRGSFVNTIVDGTALPGTTIDDSQIATELSNLISAGTVPPNDANNLYFFYFPPGVTITLEGESSCSAFCGYHSTTTIGGSDAYYAVIPDLDPTTCGGCAISGQTQLQSTTEVSSHELAEAITDAAIGLDLSDPSFPEAPVAWYNVSSGEVGDICAWQPATLAGYTVQLIWSNAAGACTDAPTTSGDAGTDASDAGSDAAGDATDASDAADVADAGPTNLIQNGGFETGDTSDWTIGKGRVATSAAEAHSGSFSALIGVPKGYRGVSDVTQVVTIPTSGTTTLSFWGNYTCAGADANEYERVRVLSSTGTVLRKVLSACTTSGAWAETTANLSKYAGQTITLDFVARDDKAGLAYWYLDDVSVTNE